MVFAFFHRSNVQFSTNDPSYCYKKNIFNETSSLGDRNANEFCLRKLSSSHVNDRVNRVSSVVLQIARETSTHQPVSVCAISINGSPFQSDA